MTMVRYCAYAVVAWMRCIRRKWVGAGCGAVGEQIHSISATIISKMMIGFCELSPSSPFLTSRFLELVEYSQSGDTDLPLAETGLWIKWRSGSSLLSQVPFFLFFIPLNLPF